MASIPSTHIQKQEAIIGQLKQQVATLQAENERVKSAYNQVSAENRKLKQQLDWEKWLFSNPAYSPSEKLTIWATKPLLLKSSPNEKGLCHIPLYQVAPAIGMSRATIGRNFIKLSETTPDIKRDADRNETELGTWNTDVYVTFSEALLSRPDTTTRLEPRNQGGKRKKKCSLCGKENLVEETKIICQDCGCVQSKTIRPVNPPDKVQPQEGDPTEEQLVQRCEIQEDGILDHTPYMLLLAQPEDTFPEGFSKPTTPLCLEEPRDNLSAVLKPEKPRDKLSLGEVKPATPPRSGVVGHRGGCCRSHCHEC